MILRKQKILFTHIPRTGGTSIENYFLKKFNLNESILNLTAGKNNHFVNLRHLPYNQIKHEWLSNGEFLDEEWVQFSIIRNPYAKVMSELFFWTDLGVAQDFQQHSNYEFRQVKILEALKVYISNTHKFNKDWMRDGHLYSQSWYLKDIPSNYKVFKFEEGINNIMDRLGFEDFKNNNTRSQDKLSQYNLKDVNYNDYMNQEFIEIVNKYYKEDFDRFDYDIL